MTGSTLRTWVGLVLVLSHFGLLVLSAVLAFLDMYTLDEMFALFGILSPLFGAYTTVIFRHFLKQAAGPDEGPKVRRSKIFVSLLMPGFFVSIIALGILWKAFGSIGFGDVVKLVGATETLLGIYVAMVVETFFGPPEEAKAV